MARICTFVLAGGWLAISLALTIGIAGLEWPAYLGWLVVASGLPVAPALAGALGGRRALAGVVFVALAAVLIVGLMHARVPWWPTDVRSIGRAGAIRLVVLAGATLLLAWMLRRWRVTGHDRVAWTVTAIAAGVAISALVVVAGYLRTFGLLPFAQGGRVAAYDRLWTNLERFYTRWDHPAVPLAEVRERYRERIVAIDRACGYFGACAAYRDAIREMLAELRDGHTYVAGDDGMANPPLSIAALDGQAIVTAGEHRGDAIIEVNGSPVADRLAHVPTFLIAYSSPQLRERERYANVLVGPRGSHVRITFERIDGTRTVADLARSSDLFADPGAVTGRAVAPGIVEISVPHLRAASVVAQFDDQLSRLRAAGAHGLVLDLRGNGGGWSGFGAQIASRLVSARVTYGRTCFRGEHPLRHGGGCVDHVIDPGPSPFTGRIAVLIDAGVASSGEQLTLALCATGRARCFGTRTGGNTGDPLPHFLPGATVLYSTGELYTPANQPVDGTGIVPDVVVPTSRADVATGRDPVLEAAVRWLSEP